MIRKIPMMGRNTIPTKIPANMSNSPKTKTPQFMRFPMGNRESHYKLLAEGYPEIQTKEEHTSAGYFHGQSSGRLSCLHVSERDDKRRGSIPLLSFSP
jgi:hypothetical protein